jgi:hypothetical protein
MFFCKELNITVPAWDTSRRRGKCICHTCYSKPTVIFLYYIQQQPSVELFFVELVYNHINMTISVHLQP